MDATGPWKWDAHLEDTKAVSTTRERSKAGVDASSYNKIFMYRVPEKKPQWCLGDGGGLARKIAAAGGLVVTAAAAAAALSLGVVKKKR